MYVCMIFIGHQFQMRCGHSQDKGSRQEDQLSPIFLQFLDCVWQVLRQHPHYFEFNARYLLVVADHIYSGRFGTFLFNSDLDRVSFVHLSSAYCGLLMFSGGGVYFCWFVLNNEQCYDHYSDIVGMISPPC